MSFKTVHDVIYKPVTSENLTDLEKFARAHGKFGYCSCMRWRMRSSEFGKSTKEERREKLHRMVKQNIPVGIFAYADGVPVGWCSIAPRETYRALENHKPLPRIDKEDVWSVACFFVDRKHRRKRLSLGLLSAAVEYAKSCGANIVEGYPVDPNSTSYTFMGAPGIFKSAGFKDVTPKGQKRRVVRYYR